MITTALTAAVAREHVSDLLRDAASARIAARLLGDTAGRAKRDGSDRQ